MYCCRRLILIFFSALLILPPDLDAASRYNKSAQSLARTLGSSSPAKKNDQGAIGGLGKKMISVIELLERSYRTSGPTPESLISKALDFRPDMGRWEKLMLSNSVLTAWREANALGLFDKNGKFRTEVSQGRGIGDRVMFELIVSGENYPPASNQLANVRLVRESDKRTDPKAITPREQATREQLVKMIDEKGDLAERKKWENHKANQLGQTSNDHEQLWKAEVEAAGEEARAMPNIRVTGDTEATPSHATKGRWRVNFEVINNSTHPTEVKVEAWLVGHTWKKRDYYIMAKSEQVLKLRRNQAFDFDVFTKSEGSYKNRADDHDELSKAERRESKVRFRGYAIRVTHEKGIVTFTGNDQRLASFVDPSVDDRSIDSLPKF